MPSIRHPLHYPKEYFTVIEKAAVKGLPTTVECESEAAARKLRGHFYAFIGALKRATAKEEYQDEYGWSQRTMCYLEGATLTFMPRDESWQAQAMRRGLAGGEEVTGPELVIPPEFLQEFLEKDKK